jgi:tRNA pseudouridine55 synthase
MNGGQRRRWRELDGIVLLDKPQGLSSNDALQKVRRIFGAAKAGHTGALDPLATGMLPICFGEATKFAGYLLDADKGYRTTARLGVRTTTSDAEGEVVSEKPVDVSLEQLNNALAQFRGPQQQVPSIWSALKYEGHPYYWYARRGIDIPRPARAITIYQLELVAFDGVDAVLDVRCSKGTYIRSLVDDLGELLGCGAHVSTLRRTAVSNFPLTSMHSLEAFAALRGDGETPAAELDALLLPLTWTVQDLPKLQLNDAQAIAVGFGQKLAAAQTNIAEMTDLAEGARLQLWHGEQFLGIAELVDGTVHPKRMISQRPVVE